MYFLFRAVLLFYNGRLFLSFGIFCTLLQSFKIHRFHKDLVSHCGDLIRFGFLPLFQACSLLSPEGFQLVLDSLVSF